MDIGMGNETHVVLDNALKILRVGVGKLISERPVTRSTQHCAEQCLYIAVSSRRFAGNPFAEAIGPPQGTVGVRLEDLRLRCIKILLFWRARY